MNQPTINTANLPPELVAELKLNRPRKKRTSNPKFVEVLQIIENNNGKAFIDEVIVGIYHLSNRVEKREVIQARLCDMKCKNLLMAIKRGSGCYATTAFGREYLAKAKAGQEQEPLQVDNTRDESVVVDEL